MKRPYSLKKRKPQNVWYYKLAGQITYHSTGQTAKAKAMVLKVLKPLKVASGKAARLKRAISPKAFRTFTKPRSIPAKPSGADTAVSGGMAGNAMAVPE